MKIHKNMLFSIPVLVILAAVFLGYKIWATIQHMEEVTITSQNLPSVALRNIDGTILFTDSLKESKDLLVLNYFNPDCDHCKNMVQELFRERSLLENVRWLMVTTNTVENTQRFADSMNIAQLPNVTVLNDTTSFISKTFGAVSVPSFYVYRKGTLIRKHTGECSIAYLVQQ